ncbi:hypothetical protein TWF730_006249 [Orbilia blumenaviensis]|uniref:F-box domain-containing protein n=1 Tax=Orbilia blumenaviensis TaxID=1796055 RepID=A0AAV9VDR7_9PEZI
MTSTDYSALWARQRLKFSVLYGPRYFNTLQSPLYPQNSANSRFSNLIKTMPLLSLPVELQTQILTNLDWDDHCRCFYVCKLWGSIILSSKSLKGRWYTHVTTPDAESGLHAIFTTPGLEYVYTADGFRVILPPAVIPASGSTSEVTDKGYRMRLTSKFPLLQEPVLEVPEPGSNVQEVAHNIYLLGIPLCGDGMIKIPWDQLNGVTVEETGYVRASVTTVLEFLEELVWPEPDIPPEKGQEYKFKFWFNGNIPWIVGLKEILTHTVKQGEFMVTRDQFGLKY